jgi:nitrogen fixation protein FixH
MPIDLMPPARPGPRPVRVLTGRHVLFALIAFFAVVFGVNLVMMTLALRTMPGTQTRSAYEASQRFNHELDRIAAQDRRGWQVEIGLAALAGGGPVAVEARDREGNVLSGLEAMAQFERPADARFDQRIMLTERGGGRYAGVPESLAPGQWLLTVTLAREGETLFVSRRKFQIPR